MKPSGAGAVMASRAAEQPNEHDYFPTPPAAARAGAEIALQLDPCAASADDPGCGEGHLLFGAQDYFASVSGGDLVDYDTRFQGRVADYLDPDAPAHGPGPPPDLVMINPPFVDGEAFIRRAWEVAERGVAVLQRMQFTESADRFHLFTRDCPLAMTATFAERVPMFAGYWDPSGSTATAYRWFYFLKEAGLETSPLRDAIWAARREGCWLERLIPPGTIARLTRPADLLEFGPRSVVACRRLAGACDATPKGVKRAEGLAAAGRRIQALLDAQASPLFGEGG